MLLIAAAAGHCVTQALAQSVRIDFTQLTSPTADVVDQDLIEYLLFELIIEPAQPPDRLRVIDLTKNGYGPDDVIVAYPSLEVFLVPAVLPDSVQRVMSGWFPSAEFKLDAGNLPTEALAALVAESSNSQHRAEKAILYDVAHAVERNYKDLPIGLRFDRDSLGFTFQVWGYSKEAMQHAPRPAFVADTTQQAVMELLAAAGYLPAERSELDGPLPDRQVSSANTVLDGLTGVPDLKTRQATARTVLLGSYDFDRSGFVDAASEIDALDCEIWRALEKAFPRLLDEYGFDVSADLVGKEYFGSLSFGISRRVRVPAARRARACLQRGVPPPTSPEDVEDVIPPEEFSESLRDFVDAEVVARIVSRTASLAAGSAARNMAVGAVLVDHYDADDSGFLDSDGEIDAVPCIIWEVVEAILGENAIRTAFAPGAWYYRQQLGVASTQQERTRGRIELCRDIRQTVAELLAEIDGQ